MPSRFPRTLTTGLALLLLAPLGAAQLDLPERPRTPPGAGGARELPSRVSGDRSKDTRPDLDLPSGEATPAPAPASSVTPPPAPPGTPVEQALLLLEGLDGPGRPSAERQREVAEGLVRLGPDGLEACRRVLAGLSPAPLAPACRHLVAHGTPEDRAAVAERLTGPWFEDAGAVLGELARRDPVTLDPALLAELLEHSSGTMRKAAQSWLAQRLEPTAVPWLAGRLASERADTRLRALELLGGIRDESVPRLVASRLGDTNARVAATAMEYFARSDDPGVGAELRRIAFEEGRGKRSGAYALLALVEREDRQGKVELSFDDVPPLLEDLEGEPIVAGAAACALAGIGFRVPASPASAWLDLRVPHTLVRLASGVEFHRDFTSLQPIALRRLARISGKDFGLDGARWREWWLERAGDFHALRAVISVPQGAEDELEVELVRGAGDSLRLVGPAAAVRVGAGTYRMDASGCRETIALLRQEGVLGLERLPRTREEARERLFTLRVLVAGQEKRFDAPLDAVPAWMERIEEALRERARVLAWQTWAPDDPARRRAFFEVETPWWGAEHSARERAERSRELLLAWLPTRAPEARDGGLRELSRVVEEYGLARPQDFEPLVALLEEEPHAGPRATLLAGLALRAALAEDGLGADERDVMVETLVRLGLDSEVPLSGVIVAGGATGLERARASEDPAIRLAAARAAAATAGPGGAEALLALAEDPDPRVRERAIQGLTGGLSGTEDPLDGADAPAVAPRGEVDPASPPLRADEPGVREAVLAHAAHDDPDVRAAALRGLGRMGGTDARDALVLGMAEHDEAIKLAALRGLADLADPSTTSLLVSVLVRDDGPEWLAAARRGLKAIGEPAVPHLLRVARAPTSAGQEEAALLLAEAGVPEAAEVLLTLYTVDPDDARVARELAILSGEDFRRSPDPVDAAWSWWEIVVHDDALAWFCAGVEQAGLRSPPPDALRGEGTAEGAMFLFHVLTSPLPEHLVERARRELERLLGAPVEGPPGSSRVDQEERAAWSAELEARVRARYGLPPRAAPPAAAGGEAGPR